MAQLNYLTDEPSLFVALTPENLDLLGPRGAARSPPTSPRPAGSSARAPGLDAPDVQFHFAPSLFFDEGLTAPHDHGFCFGPVVIKPTSRGRVRLRTPRPDSKPRRAVQLPDRPTRTARACSPGRASRWRSPRQPALAAVARGPFSVPASDSDADIMACVRRAAQTVYHPTSTCAMGAVVDSELRVYGFEALRVADASVMPTITRGNTNAPTIMIAERAADLIRAASGTQATADVL